jgi:hypothetical protein
MGRSLNFIATDNGIATRHKPHLPAQITTAHSRATMPQTFRQQHHSMCTWYVESQSKVQPYWREAARRSALYVRTSTPRSKAEISPHCCVPGPTSEVSDTEKISRTRSPAVPVGVPSAEGEGNRTSGQPLHMGKAFCRLHVVGCVRSRGWRHLGCTSVLRFHCFTRRM